MCFNCRAQVDIWWGACVLVFRRDPGSFNKDTRSRLHLVIVCNWTPGTLTARETLGVTQLEPKGEKYYFLYEVQHLK